MNLTNFRFIVIVSLAVTLSVIVTAAVLIRYTMIEIEHDQRQSMRFLGHDIAISGIPLDTDQLNDVANSIRANVGNDKAGDDFMKGYVREWCMRHPSVKNSLAKCTITDSE